jgi:hypothetical protein
MKCNLIAHVVSKDAKLVVEVTVTVDGSSPRGVKTAPQPSGTQFHSELRVEMWIGAPRS